MLAGLERLARQTDDPLVLVLLLVSMGLIVACATLFRAWTNEIKAHRETIQENIEWTRQNTVLIGEVRQNTERFAGLISQLAHYQRLMGDR